MSLDTAARAPSDTAAAPWAARAHAPVDLADDLAVLVAGGAVTWGTEGSVALPGTVSPSLAALAPKLALALRQTDAGGRGPAVLELGAYDTHGFLLHQVALLRDPSVRVVAGVVGGIQAEVAAAFGAELAAPSGRRAPAGSPLAAEVGEALALLASVPWRFVPAITLAVSEREWQRERSAGTLDHGLEALVHP